MFKFLANMFGKKDQGAAPAGPTTTPDAPAAPTPPAPEDPSSQPPAETPPTTPAV